MFPGAGAAVLFNPQGRRNALPRPAVSSCGVFLSAVLPKFDIRLVRGSFAICRRLAQGWEIAVNFDFHHFRVIASCSIGPSAQIHHPCLTSRVVLSPSLHLCLTVRAITFSSHIQLPCSHRCADSLIRCVAMRKLRSRLKLRNWSLIPCISARVSLVTVVTK